MYTSSTCVRSILNSLLLLLLGLHYFIPSQFAALAAGRDRSRSRSRSYHGAPLPLELYPVSKPKNANSTQALTVSEKWYKNRVEVCGADRRSYLVRRQYPHLNNLCRRSSRWTETVHNYVMDGLRRCRERYKNKRWNCVFERHFLSSGTKEAALVWALVAAHAVHGVALECQRGRENNCRCPNWQNGTSTQANYMKKGCPNYMKFPQKKVRQYFNDRKFPSGLLNFTHLINKHNRRLGIRRVKNMPTIKCRCHGMSGSCGTKVCYKTIEPFAKVEASIIKSVYTAQRVRPDTDRRRSKLKLAYISLPAGKITTAFTKRTTRGTSDNKRKFRPKDIPSKNTLVFSNFSPDFCAKRPRMGWPGVENRICNTTGLQDENCHVVCCSNNFTPVFQNKIEQTNCRIVRGGTQLAFKVVCDSTLVKIPKGKCTKNIRRRARRSLDDILGLTPS